MEKLKLILKKALGELAMQATLKEGEVGELVFSQTRSSPLTEFGMVDGTWLEGLFKTLFPREGLALRAGEFVRGQISIVNIGKVFLIADPRAPKTLHLFFPPNGELMSEQFLARLKEAVKAKVPPPPPPPAARMASPGSTTAMPSAEQMEAFVAATALAPNAVVAGEAPPPPPPPPRESSYFSTGPHETRHTKTSVVSVESKPPPNEVSDNRKRLVLVISQNEAVISGTASIAEQLKFFPFTVNSGSVFSSILDRYDPHLILIDESATDFQEILKKIYDFELDKRLHMTVVLISKSSTSKDTRAAFMMSVDLIANQNELEKLKEIVLEAHSQRADIVKSWAALKTND